MGLVAASVALASPKQTMPPLGVKVQYYSVDKDTKYVVTFTNRSDYPIEQLRIQQVGLRALSRTFRPAAEIPTIKAGKTYTFNVLVRGTIVQTAPDDVIYVTGLYRNNSQSSQALNYHVKICNVEN